MKKTILLIGIVFTTMFAYPQSGLNFKGLVTDNSGNPLANQVINVRMTVFEGNTARWQEEHAGVSTDAYGIFSVNMGEGTKVGGTQATFDEVNWNHNNMNYRVEINSGSGYQILVDHEPFKYVPYAKSAKKITGVQDKLGVGDMPIGIELVRFSRANMGSDYDVLDLEMTGSSSDYAQFIECNKNGVTKFKVNGNGDVYTAGNIDVDGKLHGTDSGDADMKAYIYGRIDWNGNIIFPASSSGFTAFKVATGQYRITFSNSPGSSDSYMVIATAGHSQANIGVSQSSDDFEIYIRNIATNTYMDKSFNFVVYKK
jgi:hypothetical protein